MRVERRRFPDSGDLVEESELLPVMVERRRRKEGMVVKQALVSGVRD